MSARFVTVTGLAVLMTVSLWPSRASAQVDLTGQWAQIVSGNAKYRGPGPDIGDQPEIPLNEDARAFVASYAYSSISMPERMCMVWSQDYITITGHQIMIERINDPVNGGTVGWGISSGGSDRSPLPIWIDGRPHPSDNDMHTTNGFTTGTWEGGVLTGHMTHMARGITQRNGAPLSDKATMTIHVTRHDDYLEIMTITEDPVYLEAPYVVSTSYRRNPIGNALPVNAPCYPLSEVPSLDVPGTVPHWLPGQNADLNLYGKQFNIPPEIVLGGKGHDDPSIRKTLKDSYKIPAECHVLDGGRQDCIVGPPPKQ
jgi:hypothetical protein